jgi:hypothetical protein
MSKRSLIATMDQQTEAEERISADMFQKIVAECVRIKGNVSEYSGQLGQYRRNQVERYSLNPKAFALANALNNMDEAKRQDFLRSLIQYALFLGFFDQIDAFDDLNTLLRRALGEDQEQEDPVESNVRLLRDGINLLDDLAG